MKRTGDIGAFVVISESAVSAGVRRIEALTADNAMAYFYQQDQRMVEIAELLKTSEADAPTRIKSLLDDRKKMEQQISELRKQLATGGGGSANDTNVKEIDGYKFTGRVLDGIPAKDLKSMADELKSKLGSAVIVLVATNEGKASIVVGVTEDLTDKVNAVDLVRIGAEALGGKGGGGRPDMAQAGGPNADAANDAVSAIESSLAS